MTIPIKTEAKRYNIKVLESVLYLEPSDYLSTFKGYKEIYLKTIEQGFNAQITNCQDDTTKLLEAAKVRRNAHELADVFIFSELGMEVASQKFSLDISRKLSSLPPTPDEVSRLVVEILTQANSEFFDLVENSLKITARNHPTFKKQTDQALSNTIDLVRSIVGQVQIHTHITHVNNITP